MKLSTLPLDLVYPNPEQPRKLFDADALAELGRSISENGLHQPIKVRPDGAGRYMIVCGERRWRAHKLIEASEIPALVEDMTDDQLEDVAIIENLQRLDITPLEEAKAFQRRLEQGVPMDDLARRLGVTVNRIERRIALLNLAPEYQDLFVKGQLEQNQANHLARLSHPYQRLLFQAISSGKCNSRPSLRALADALYRKQLASDGDAPLELRDANLEGEQTSMFGDTGPTEAQRAALTSMERKIEAVTELVCSGFDENEVVVAGKVSRGNAGLMADKIELLEKHLRKMRIELQKQAALESSAA